jgi:hypothetical protein
LLIISLWISRIFSEVRIMISIMAWGGIVITNLRRRPPLLFGGAGKRDGSFSKTDHCTALGSNNWESLPVG